MFQTLVFPLLLAALPAPAPRGHVRPADLPAPRITGLYESDVGVVVSWASDFSYDGYRINYTLKGRYGYDLASGGAGGTDTIALFHPLPADGLEVDVWVEGGHPTGDPFDSFGGFQAQSPPSATQSKLAINLITVRPTVAPLKRKVPAPPKKTPVN